MECCESSSANALNAQRAKALNIKRALTVNRQRPKFYTRTTSSRVGLFGRAVKLF